jgi:hypothetical protein
MRKAKNIWGQQWEILALFGSLFGPKLLIKYYLFGVNEFVYKAIEIKK